MERKGSSDAQLRYLGSVTWTPSYLPTLLLLPRPTACGQAGHRQTHSSAGSLDNLQWRPIRSHSVFIFFPVTADRPWQAVPVLPNALTQSVASIFTHYSSDMGARCTSRRDGEDAERQAEARWHREAFQTCYLPLLKLKNHCLALLTLLRLAPNITVC